MNKKDLILERKAEVSRLCKEIDDLHLELAKENCKSFPETSEQYSVFYNSLLKIDAGCFHVFDHVECGGTGYLYDDYEISYIDKGTFEREYGSDGLYLVFELKKAGKSKYFKIKGWSSSLSDDKYIWESAEPVKPITKTVYIYEND